MYCADGNLRYVSTEGEPRRDPGSVGWSLVWKCRGLDAHFASQESFAPLETVLEEIQEHVVEQSSFGYAL